MYTSLGEARSRPACYGDIGAMIHCDSGYPDIVAWRTKDFKHCIRDEDMRCQIVEVGGIFAGYMITETYISTLEIWRIVVDKSLLRCQIGSCLVRGLCEQLMLPKRGPYHKLRNIIADVSEENLRGQLFFKSMGFRAKLPLVHDEGESFIRFVYEQFGGRLC